MGKRKSTTEEKEAVEEPTKWHKDQSGNRSPPLPAAETATATAIAPPPVQPEQKEAASTSATAPAPAPEADSDPLLRCKRCEETVAGKLYDGECGLCSCCARCPKTRVWWYDNVAAREAFPAYFHSSTTRTVCDDCILQEYSICAFCTRQGDPLNAVCACTTCADVFCLQS